MPRGRKSYTLEEQLEITTREIAETEASLKNLKKKKKELDLQIRQKNISELYDIIQESGKTVEEVKTMLQ